MSVQFGNWNFSHSPGAAFAPAAVRRLLAAYGPDGESAYRETGLDILHFSLQETEESRHELQPYRIGSEQVLTWDGRLDNRAELTRELSEAVPASVPDVAIVAAAYRRWGLACLPKLVGDWALCVWHPAERRLVLAKDFMGTRSLFYAVHRGRAQWCTVLDPLVLCAGHSFGLSREYLAGWFGLFPASHLTPYEGIYSVPPASCVIVTENSVSVSEFWQFAAGKTVVYRNDADYEEGFRHLFGQAVRRRLRSQFPILAELSGGMDSSSIVCMADRIHSAAASPTPRLDTISYHSSVEPNWNELPYVARVEEQRGRTGFHVEVGTEDGFRFDSDPGPFMATPGSLHSSGQSGREFSKILRENGSRVLLSGIGGDEVLGGAPSPSAMLAELLANGRLRSLCQQLVAWALVLRKPAYSLFSEALALFFREQGATRSVDPPEWLCRDFLDRNSRAVRGYPRRTHLFGPRPTFQESLATIEALRRQLSCYPLSAGPTYQKCYPYLDRDLLEFLFAIPQEQLLRPHQRRSLMRRAMAGIVPQELLQRKRKAFVIRGPLVAISRQYATLEATAGEMIGASLGIVDSRALVASLKEARAGGQTIVTSLLRVFAIERWLRNAAHWGVLQDVEPYARKMAPENSRWRLPVKSENSLS